MGWFCQILRIFSSFLSHVELRPLGKHSLLRSRKQGSKWLEQNNSDHNTGLGRVFTRVLVRVEM